ncbi:hypothetical protein [Bosea sp. TAF32]|uniref:hypothetical protein n=1 Tax=Bosea sp. TAF32 TaxID=3237482 RepID=UPI003F8DBDB6
MRQHHVYAELERLGYDAEWRAIEGPDFGLAQNRRCAILVALRRGLVQAKAAGANRGSAPSARRTSSRGCSGSEAQSSSLGPSSLFSRVASRLRQVRTLAPRPEAGVAPHSPRSQRHRGAAGSKF